MSPDNIIPAWEDPYHFIFQERKTPINIDPRVSHIDEPEERRRLVKILEKGLRNKVGFALPLSRGQYGESSTWVSGRWIVRTETLFLYPGDSPIGYRLPLDSLFGEPEERIYIEEYDPSAPRGELPSYQALQALGKQASSNPRERTAPVRVFPDSVLEREGDRSLKGDRWNAWLPSDSFYPFDRSWNAEENWGGVVRTALCVEPREGRLNVFMPSLRYLEQYLELVACVEEIAEELKLPVCIEGYPPPNDPRLKQFKVTPDPVAIEFRFPRIGVVAYDGVEIELRQAIEPWHVLGEEQSSQGTSRYVDSSLERIQIKASGAVDPRHQITCNGAPVPLHPTGRQGEFCAGICYRAWQPPSCLHPAIPVHTPLVFDLVDTWNQRSLGGCTYHVMHPGGRNCDAFPVNALEAESRRSTRFEPFGHTPGVVQSQSAVKIWITR